MYSKRLIFNFVSTNRILSASAKNIFRFYLFLIIKKFNEKNSITLINIILYFKRKKTKFGLCKEKNLFFVKDNNNKHYFYNLNRGLNLYYQGLKEREYQIIDSYKLKHIKLRKNDLVIECGANYGDLWLYLKDKINPQNYITFEPGTNEYKSLINNAPYSKNINKALGNKNKILKFYVNEKDADSSIIKPINYEFTRKIEVLMLDDFIKKEKINKIKLLKLEAEGFEPEILEGCKKSLEKISYIALDGGNERGINLEETMSKQLNFLIKNGFKIKEINFKWGRALLYKPNN